MSSNGGTHSSTVEREVMHIILFGGDQMTIKMARDSQIIRSNFKSQSAHPQGLHLVAEDWLFYYK